MAVGQKAGISDINVKQKMHLRRDKKSIWCVNDCLSWRDSKERMRVKVHGNKKAEEMSNEREN